MSAETDLDKALRVGWNRASAAAFRELKERRKNGLRQLFRTEQVDADAVAVRSPSARTRTPVGRVGNATFTERGSIPVTDIQVSAELRDPMDTRDLVELARQLAENAYRAENRFMASALEQAADMRIKLENLDAALRRHIESLETRPAFGLVVRNHLGDPNGRPNGAADAAEARLKAALQGPIIDGIDPLPPGGLLVPHKRSTLFYTQDFQLHRPSSHHLALTTGVAVKIHQREPVRRLVVKERRVPVGLVRLRRP